MRSNVVATKPRPLGRCGPNAQEQVTTERQGIVIEPANPEFIYPPVYSPAVYGPWPYPDYPPLDISPDDYGVGFPLPWAMILGFAVWGDVPTPGLLVGSAIVAASSLYILWRETVRRRRPVVPAPQRG